MMATRLDLERLFMEKFRKGEVKVFIIVSDIENESKPFVALIHRLRFGSEILPIPAWLSQMNAELFLQSHRDVLKMDKVMGITSHTLQEMIEKHEYDASYPQTKSYHLDLQADDVELKVVLGLEVHDV